MAQDRAQTFNDGLVDICAVENTAEPGNMPKEGLVSRVKLRYAERTVGINRFYSAAQSNVKVDRLIRCLRLQAVSTQNIARIGGDQYHIRQIQYPEDITPKVMDLTLERVMQNYDS